jgi:hypothetical protein
VARRGWLVAAVQPSRLSLALVDPDGIEVDHLVDLVTAYIGPGGKLSHAHHHG